MPNQTIDIGLQTPIAAASALKKAGYSVTSAGKPVNVSETEDVNQEQPKQRGIQSLGANEFETLYKWVTLYGGKDLLLQKNIPNGTFLVRGLIKGTITPEEIDAVTNHPEGYVFSELPMFNQIASEIDSLKKNPIEEGKGAIHSKKWDRCVKKVKATGKSEKSAYKICSSSIENAGVKASHQQKTGKQYVANRKEANEGETMLDVFPELNQCEPEKGGEVKDIKLNKTHTKKAEKPKEEKPTLKRKETKEVKQINKKKMTETFFTKSELLEAIGGGSGSPQVDPGQSPTETPTKPAEPSKRPERKNPFRPKPGPNPNPKGQIPTWMSSDVLGLGKEVAEDISEVQKLINKLI